MLREDRYNLYARLRALRTNQRNCSTIGRHQVEQEIMGHLGEIDGETKESVSLFLGAPKSLQMVIAALKVKDAYSLEEKL